MCQPLSRPVDRLPYGNTIKSYSRDTVRAANARSVMRGITRLTDFKSGLTMPVMETRRDHNHNQRDNHPEVDRIPDDVIFSAMLSRSTVVPESTPTVFNHRPASVNGAIPGHPQPTDQPQIPRRRSWFIPTVNSHNDCTP